MSKKKSNRLPVNWHTIVGMLGKTRTGKTSLMLELIKNEKRLVILDPTNNPMFDGYFPCNDILEVAHALVKPEFQIVCRFDMETNLRVCRMLTHSGMQNFSLVIDELAVYTDAYSNPDVFDELFLRGGRFNRRIIWNTQRPANIHRNCTTQTILMFAFRLDELADVKYLSSHLRNGREIEFYPKGQYIVAKGDAEDLKHVEAIYGFNFNVPCELGYITLKCIKPEWWRQGDFLPEEVPAIGADDRIDCK